MWSSQAGLLEYIILLVVALPAAALWYWGILVSGRLRLGSSLRMSRLSFRLLLFDVFADLHLVFLLGIFVGNFIFNFLLFSCRNRERCYRVVAQKQTILVLFCCIALYYCSITEVMPYLGSRAGTCKQSGASSGLNIWRTRHTGTEDLRGATKRHRNTQKGLLRGRQADLTGLLLCVH